MAPRNTKYLIPDGNEYDVIAVESNIWGILQKK